MVVIGAGVIGIEYATIFSALDTAVTVIDPKSTMLDFIDKEIVEDFTYQLRDRNMKLLLGQKAEKVEKLDNGKVRADTRQRPPPDDGHGAVCRRTHGRHRYA